MGTIPSAPPAPTAPDLALSERRLAAVERLVDIGMDLAEAMHRQATDPDAPKVFPGDLALGFSRISRAIQLTLILAQRLQDGLPDVVAEVEAEAREAGPAAAANDVDEPDGERLIIARGDRENEETVWLKRPVNALVAQICRDLDTRYDAELWGDAPGAPASSQRAFWRPPDSLLPLREKVSAQPTDEGSLRIVGVLESASRTAERNPSSDLLRRPPSPARGEGKPYIQAASEYRPP